MGDTLWRCEIGSALDRPPADLRLTFSEQIILSIKEGLRTSRAVSPLHRAEIGLPQRQWNAKVDIPGGELQFSVEPG
jgi:hypothetical protein